MGAGVADALIRAHVGNVVLWLDHDTGSNVTRLWIANGGAPLNAGLDVWDAIVDAVAADSQTMFMSAIAADWPQVAQWSSADQDDAWEAAQALRAGTGCNLGHHNDPTLNTSTPQPVAQATLQAAAVAGSQPGFDTALSGLAWYGATSQQGGTFRAGLRLVVRQALVL